MNCNSYLFQRKGQSSQVPSIHPTVKKHLGKAPKGQGPDSVRGQGQDEVKCHDVGKEVDKTVKGQNETTETVVKAEEEKNENASSRHKVWCKSDRWVKFNFHFHLSLYLLICIISAIVLF